MGDSLKKLYQLLKPDIRSRLHLFFVVAGLAAVVSFGHKALIWFVKVLVDQVLGPSVQEPGEAAPVPPEGPPEPTARVMGLADSGFAWVRDKVGDVLFGAELDALEEKWAALWAVVLLVMMVTIVIATAQYCFTMLSRWVTLRVVIELRMRLARHLMGLSLRYHGRRKFGDLLSRISSDVTATLNILQLAIKDLTMEPLQFLGALAVAGYLAPIPTLGVIVFIPLIALPLAILGRRVRRRSTRSLASLGASVEVLTEIFRGIRIVKAFRAEARETQRYRVTNEKFMSTSMRMVRAVAAIQTSTTLMSNMGMAFLVLLVGSLSLKYDLFSSMGGMLGFFMAISVSYGHVKRMVSTMNKVQEAAGAAVRLQAILDEKVDVIESPEACSLDSLGSGIRFEGVCLRYPDTESDALHRLDIEVRPNETLALVGPSGAGKTTFVDLIARFIDPTEGRISVDGIDLRELSLDSWTGLYAMVGQDPFLFHTTLLENIRYGDPEASREEIEQAARGANIHDFIVGLPEGYETVVGDLGAHLSGGQRQRITIARAILKRAPVLLLDEATSALDSASEAVVQEALERLMADRTVVVIAHRLSTIRDADRIAVLDGGKLVDIGSHDELIKRGGLYTRLCTAQFAGDPAT